MIWTISLPCSRAGERAHPTKLPTHRTASPRTLCPGALTQRSLRTFQAFPFWERALGAGRTHTVHERQRHSEASEPRGSPRGQGPPRVRSIQKALGHCVRGLSASSYSPAAHSVYARLLLPQAQAVGDHGDELRVRRLALDVRDRVAEKLLQRLNIAAVPRDLDRVPDGALNA